MRLRITYLSEPWKPYQDAISCARNREELRDAIKPFLQIADDAMKATRDMNWPEWQRGLTSERRGRFAGEEWEARYGAILMPEVMFKVSLIAFRFKMPWGAAYIRLRDVGRLRETKDRIARIAND